MKKYDIVSPYKVGKVIFQRKYPGYIYRRELVDDSEYGGDGALEMVNCYSSDTGHWIGRARTARNLCKKYGLRQLQKTDPAHDVASIGFNESEQKWYGWSHRAIYGFGVGSRCKKGNCGYTPGTVDELYDSMIRPDESGWAWQKPENVEKIANGVRIKHAMCHHTIENEDGSLSGWVEDEPDYQVVEIGRGEWEAKTLEDAKQMAIDFASGVS